jgi:hypothetical protein
MGGTLFLAGTPNRPDNSQPYDVTFTPVLTTPFVFYVIPRPTDFLVNGASAGGASDGLSADPESSSWIVDSGEYTPYLGTELKVRKPSEDAEDGRSNRLPLVSGTIKRKRMCSPLNASL